MRPLLATDAHVLLSAGARRHAPCSAIDGTSLTLFASSSAAFCLQNTPPGRLLSAPMVSFSLALGLSNAGLLPMEHPSYGLCTQTLLPVSVCLGLLSTAAAPSEAADGGASGPLQPMLIAFAIGAFGTLLGALSAYAACTRLRVLPPSAAAAASTLLCATYIGGSANFFGVATALQGAELGALVPALLAADLALMGLYFVVLAAATQLPWLQRLYPDRARLAPAQAATATEDRAPAAAATSSFDTMWTLGAAVAAVLVCRGARAAEARLRLPGTGILLLSLLSSTCARWLAQCRPVVANAMAGLAAPSLLLSCLFLGSLGASARLKQVLIAGPAALLAAVIVLVVHSGMICAGTHLANRFGAAISLREMLVASNANVGGSATAMAMAAGRQWYDLLSPSAVCGTIGYASATLVSLCMHHLLTH